MSKDTLDYDPYDFDPDIPDGHVLCPLCDGHQEVRRPMIYIDHHNTNGYTDAYVMTDPDAEFYPIASGRDASTSIHNQPVTPKPKTGALVHVWTSGHWVGPDGPWRAVMLKHMADIRSEIEEIEQRERAAQAVEAAKRKAQSEASYADAVKAFERGDHA